MTSRADGHTPQYITWQSVTITVSLELLSQQLVLYLVSLESLSQQLVLDLVSLESLWYHVHLC